MGVEGSLLEPELSEEEIVEAEAGRDSAGRDSGRERPNIITGVATTDRLTVTLNMRVRVLVQNWWASIPTT